MSTQQTEASFSKLREILWPIHSYELKKFIPMFLMFFFVSFNYSLLRVMKDTLVINAPGSGSEIIPFLKLCTTPAAIIFVSIYIKLSQILSKQKLFLCDSSSFWNFLFTFPVCFIPIYSLDSSRSFCGLVAVLSSRWTYGSYCDLS